MKKKNNDSTKAYLNYLILQYTSLAPKNQQNGLDAKSSSNFPTNKD